MQYIGAMSAFLITLFMFLPAVAESPAAKECVPFAATDVPDEAQPEWEFYNKQEVGAIVPDGTQIIVRISRYYENRMKLGLELGVHEYFGKVAMKTWACRNLGEDPITKDKDDSMVAFLLNGQWYVHNMQYLDERLSLDTEGKISGVILRILDEGGRIIVERRIPRPPTP